VWTAPVASDEDPDGKALGSRERTSLVCPEGKFKSMRLRPTAAAFSVRVPDSSVDPAMCWAVPVSVKSVIDALLTSPARDC
jgi:hypothetical protein